MKSISDLVLNEIKILLPKKGHPAGRPEIDNRKALNEIIFILHAGYQFFKVPHRWIIEQAFGCLSWFRSIKICWSKTIHAALGMAQIACSLKLFKLFRIFG